MRSVGANRRLCSVMLAFLWLVWFRGAWSQDCADVDALVAEPDDTFPADCSINGPPRKRGV